MSTTVCLSEMLVKKAQCYAKANDRPIAKQIEHWAKIGKVIEDNPDLPYFFIKNVLTAKDELDAGLINKYERIR